MTRTTPKSVVERKKFPPSPPQFAGKLPKLEEPVIWRLYYKPWELRPEDTNQIEEQVASAKVEIEAELAALEQRRTEQSKAKENKAHTTNVAALPDDLAMMACNGHAVSANGIPAGVGILDLPAQTTSKNGHSEEFLTSSVQYISLAPGSATTHWCCISTPVSYT
ncbi:hypothetical protein EJ06DRAFT_556528 [Trichodelitschia bisporula]|uniref:Uncharacterized protein n=1 Tax=Trichodelitschia bisporula TaxID=703511 RepID=A0A6G1HVY7_9PEZI|nr:hypothetical protein EJ06DRAFT_556528 [Trichodelitschia bisporula]